MVDAERKKAILAAEREFERKENLARALADNGFILIGRVTSPADQAQAVRPIETADD